MKQKFTCLLLFVAFSIGAFAQNDNSYKKRSLIGVHFNALDVKSPQDWKNNGGPKYFTKFKDLDFGFSLSYWKLIGPLVDFSAKGSLLFHDYAGIDRNNYSSDYNQVGIELEPTLNFKAFRDGALFNPFLTAGIGGGLYSNKLGAYVPTGLGIEANLKNLTHIFLQAQYRFTLDRAVLRDNLLYSLGIAQNLGKDEDEPAVVIPPVIPTVPEISVPIAKAPVDTDGDGINDDEDKCPEVAGIAKYKGCPVPDSDGDGVNDDLDKCPKQPGIAKYFGCLIPDSDGDGVNDELDKCPKVVGPASNDGCPIIDKAVIEKINFSAKNINYATGSFKLLPSSYKSLDNVVELLQKDPSLLINIDGHTDDVGNAALNKTLSQNRADEVKKYLVGKGISADRLTATGYGPDKPIGDNKTKAGRASNRRTELNVRNH